MCHNFQYFDSILKFSRKKVYFFQLFRLLGIDTGTNPDQQYPDRQAMDVDPNPDLAKWCGSDPIPIYKKFLGREIKGCYLNLKEGVGTIVGSVADPDPYGSAMGSSMVMWIRIQESKIG
jgi:hypothetical protein